MAGHQGCWMPGSLGTSETLSGPLHLDCAARQHKGPATCLTEAGLVWQACTTIAG